jgi:hypothetical protein
MRLSGNSASNTEIWNMMPGIFWSHSVVEPKPNVRILAVNTDPYRTMGEDSPLPLIAAHSPGKGRVVYMGFDETWRWRPVDNGFYYRRFWGHVIGYLATKSDRRVIINTGGNRFRIGSDINIDVEAFNSDYSKLNAETFVIRRIDQETDETVEYTLKKDRPGLYRTTIEADRKGRFLLTCNPDFAPEDKIEARQIIVEMPEAEARRPEADPWTMQRLVSRDECFLGADRMEKLSELIPSGRRETREKRIYTLWDTRMALIFLVILLTVEWFLRKRANLA